MQPNFNTIVVAFLVDKNEVFLIILLQYITRDISIYLPNTRFRFGKCGLAWNDANPAGKFAVGKVQERQVIWRRLLATNKYRPSNCNGGYERDNQCADDQPSQTAHNFSLICHTNSRRLWPYRPGGRRDGLIIEAPLDLLVMEADFL